MAAHENDDHNVSDAPLASWENKELRIILRERRRWKWARDTAKTFAGYASVTVAALWAFGGELLKFLKGFGR